jgi:hypothetical protein
LNNSVPGTVDDIAALDLAAQRTEYAELAKLGDQRIPTIVLNETYAPYKAYISARAKNLTEAGTQDAGDRYAVGTGLGLLLLHEELKKKEKAGEGGKAAITEEQFAVAKQAVARSVLSIMPAFDTLARETGVEG